MLTTASVGVSCWPTTTFAKPVSKSSINACELAERSYQGMPDPGLPTKTLRVVKGDPEQVLLAMWPGPEAARHYESTKLLIAAYGISDLYGAIEDILFEFAEIYYRHHPRDLIITRRLGRWRVACPAAAMMARTASATSVRTDCLGPVGIHRELITAAAR